MLAIVTAFEVVLLGAGVGISVKITRMGGKSPLGWILITVAFALGFIRALVFLYAFATTTIIVDSAVWVAQSLTLPVAALVLAGVYSLHAEFKRVLAQAQRSIQDTEEQAGPQAA